MESLLRWGLENSSNNPVQQTEPSQPPKVLDPAIIDAILGKSDADLMKEALAVALNESKPEDDRIQALDDFEMLVEQIDNASNLENLKMWEPLQGLLTSSTDAIQRQVLWVIGTAIQNNPSAQASYLSLSPLPTLLSFLSPTVPSAKTRSKAVYTLSGLLKHNANAVRQMQDADGWSYLKMALEDSDITVRRKAAFLLNSLLFPNEHDQQPQSTPTRHANAPTLHGSETSNSATVHPNSHASMLSDPASMSTSGLTQLALEQHGIVQTLVQSLVSPLPFGPDGESEHDAEYEEKVMHVLHTYLTLCHAQILPGDKKALAGFVLEQAQLAGGYASLAEKWSMTAEDISALRQALS